MRRNLPASTWIGSAYRHIPQGGDVLDFSFAGLYRGNRWNASGEPTLYLAGDQGTLAAEWARHLPFPWPREVGHRALSRDVYRLGLRLNHVADVRSPDPLRSSGIAVPSSGVLDPSAATDIAQAIRTTTPAQAIIVPSIAFVDDHTRWNLVVFLDKVPADTNQWVTSFESVGRLQWGGD